MKRTWNEQKPSEIADAWERWAGDTQWSRLMRRFGELGGSVIWWGGFPQSKSAIPLCFVLYDPNGYEIDGKSRLKDLRHAVALLEMDK